jgi:hypothetical protein
MDSSRQYGRSQDPQVPTPWPIVFALGIILLFAGMVTSVTASILGAVLCLSALVGRARGTLPLERVDCASFRTESESAPACEKDQAGWISSDARRARMSHRVYPLSAGVKGGLAGSAVMAALAVLYGLVTRHGIWYPINLLASGFLSAREAAGQIDAFHWDALVIASAVNLVASLLVGLLYAITLPLCPRRPILWGALIAPILWSGLVHNLLESVDPTLNQRMPWLYFVLCQVGFGLVAGFVVSRQGQIRHAQHLPLTSRVGVRMPEAPADLLEEEFMDGSRLNPRT